MLTDAEIRVLRTFREFLVTPGQMICFDGPDLQKHRAALASLTVKDYVVAEHFRGGYSLTPAGFRAMKAYS